MHLNYTRWRKNFSCAFFVLAHFARDYLLSTALVYFLNEQMLDVMSGSS